MKNTNISTLLKQNAELIHTYRHAHYNNSEDCNKCGVCNQINTLSDQIAKMVQTEHSFCTSNVPNDDILIYEILIRAIKLFLKNKQNYIIV